MTRIKAKASPKRIRKLIADERHYWEYLGTAPNPTSGFFYLCDKRNGPGYNTGRRTEAEARKQIEISIAFGVCETLGIQDAHSYDWHLWCDSSEHMVSTATDDKPAPNLPDGMPSSKA